MKRALRIYAEMSSANDSASVFVELPANWGRLGQKSREKIARELYEGEISSLIASGYTVMEGEADADLEDEDDWRCSEDQL